jgi:hypothetical protein
MKNKTITYILLSVALMFVFGSLSWADSYRSEHRYYYGDKYSPRFDHKPHRHYQKNHYKKYAPKSYSQAYERHYSPHRNIHAYNKHVHAYNRYPQPVYFKRYPAYYGRYRPYWPSYAGSGVYFGTSIFEPGFSMAFSIRGR